MKVADQECINYAHECVRLAVMAEDNPELCRSLLQMAHEWMAVAMHDDKRPEPKAPPAQ